MEDFTPDLYGDVGLNYANWRQMAGFAKDSPFPADEAPKGAVKPTQQADPGNYFENLKSQVAAIPTDIGNAFDTLKSQIAAIPGMFQANQAAAAPAQSPAVATTVLPTPKPQLGQYDYSSIDD